MQKLILQNKFFILIFLFKLNYVQFLINSSVCKHKKTRIRMDRKIKLQTLVHIFTKY